MKKFNLAFKNFCWALLGVLTRFVFVIVPAFGGMTGCANEIRRPQSVDAFIQRYQAEESVFSQQHFDIFTLLKGKQGETVRVYIEGDGLAWLDRYTISPDPTPITPTALELAARDPFPLILYLARPCQYVRGEHRRMCRPEFWTTARFAEPVVADLNTAIDQAKARTGATCVQLVGHSGGGALAVLVAARRDDVSGILTLAGNLDHQAWTQLHEVTALEDSLNPKDVAASVSAIPQFHAVGGEDDNVPLSVVQSYTKSCLSSVTQVVIMKGVGHTAGWRDVYPVVLQMFTKILAISDAGNHAE